MTRITEIEIQCPCCKNRFPTRIWISTTLGPLGTDFFQQAVGSQPILVGIHACRFCGYSGYREDFEGEKLSKDLKIFVFKKIMPLTRGRELTPSLKYEVAALIAKERGDRSIDVGKLFLRAAWCCTLYEKKEVEEREYRRKAIGHFEKAFERGEIDEGLRARYTYLIGELYRRVGDQEKSLIWFEKVRDAVGGDEGKKWFIDLAIQQKTNPKEFIGE